MIDKPSLAELAFCAYWGIDPDVSDYAQRPESTKRRWVSVAEAVKCQVLRDLKPTLELAAPVWPGATCDDGK